MYSNILRMRLSDATSPDLSQLDMTMLKQLVSGPADAIPPSICNRCACMSRCSETMGASSLPLDAWHLSIGRRQDVSGAARSLAPDRYTLVIQSRIWRARARALGSSVALVQASMAIWKLSRFGWTSSSPEEYMSCMFIRIYDGKGERCNDTTTKSEKVRGSRWAAGAMGYEADRPTMRRTGRERSARSKLRRNFPLGHKTKLTCSTLSAAALLSPLVAQLFMTAL